MNKKVLTIVESINNRFIDDSQIWIRIVDRKGSLIVQYDTGSPDGVYDFEIKINDNDTELIVFEYIRTIVMIKIMPIYRR